MPSENKDTDGKEGQAVVRPFLEEQESLRATLTNTRVGVTRSEELSASDRVTGSDAIQNTESAMDLDVPGSSDLESTPDTTTIEPGPGALAVGAVTDQRLLFVVEDAEGRTDDFVATIDFEDIETVEQRDETLTHSLVVQTIAGITWECTARNPAAVEDAAAVLSRRVASAQLDAATAHQQVAADTDAPARRAEELEAALAAYRTAADLLGEQAGPVTSAEHSAREDAEAVIANLVRAHRTHAEESTAAAEWELAAENRASAYELFTEAKAAYDRAFELARAYPPGDPDAIDTERQSVREVLEPLKIEFAVAQASDN